MLRSQYIYIKSGVDRFVAGEALIGVVTQEVGRLMCRLWDDDGASDALLERTYGKNGARIVGAPVRYSKRAFKDAFCFGDEPEPRPGDFLEGTPDSGRSEGKCPVYYLYRTAVEDAAGIGGAPNTPTSPRRSLGPIGNFVNIGTKGIGIEIEGGARVTLQYGAGRVELNRPYFFEIIREDGQPDNCGDFTPGDPRPRYEGPVDYPGPNGTTITAPTTIIINNPQDNKGGRGLTIPFAWISPELNVNGKATINADGEFEIDLNGGDDGSFSADPNSPQPEPGPDSPPNPEGYREMRGVVVVSTKLGDATTTTEYGNGDSPNLYLPRCASLLFAVNVLGHGNWTQPVDIETLRQWVPVLGDLPAYLAVAKPMNGYSCQLYPVYVDDERDEPIDDE